MTLFLLYFCLTGILEVCFELYKFKKNDEKTQEMLEIAESLFPDYDVKRLILLFGAFLGWIAFPIMLINRTKRFFTNKDLF